MISGNLTFYLGYSSLSFRAPLPVVRYFSREQDPWDWIRQKGEMPGETLVCPYEPDWMQRIEQMVADGEAFFSRRHIIMLIPEDKTLLELHALAKSRFQQVPAAGGLVRNDAGDVLMIHRRGSWDLPKGKIDQGETLEEAAVRETEEETGIQNIHHARYFGTTTHFYIMKGKVVMKDTAWYTMSAPHQLLIPQAEEDIDQAIWADRATAFRYAEEAFPLVADLIRRFFVEVGG